MKPFYKYFLLLFISSVWSNMIYAQIPDVTWKKSYGGTNIEEFTDIEPTADGGQILVGYSQSSNWDISTNFPGGGNAWIVKMDRFGTTQWSRSYGGSGIYDNLRAIQPTPDGGYIATGESGSADGDLPSNNVVSQEVWVLKIDSIGNIQWSRTYGGSFLDAGTDIQLTSDGGYIGVGTTNSTDGDISVSNTGNDMYFYTDCWIFKLDSVGNLEWERVMGGYNDDIANAVQVTSDGEYIIAGSSSSYNGDVTDHLTLSYTPDIWIIKLAANGSTIWTKSLGGSLFDEAYDIIIANDGNYVIAGYSESHDMDVSNGTSHGSPFDYWIVKIDTSANLIWEKSFGGMGYDMAYSVSNTYDNGYLVMGQGSYGGDIPPYPSETGLGWLIKLDSNGTQEWNKHIVCVSKAKAKTSPDKGIIIGSNCNYNNIDNPNNHGLEDFFVAKLNAFNVDKIITPASCYNGSDGAASVNPINGIPPYTYAWSAGGNSSNQTGLSAGNYLVTITDAINRQVIVSCTITQPTPMIINSTTNNINCYGNLTGTIHLSASGATSPYTYHWEDNSINPIRAGLAAGVYNVTITDAHACQVIDSIELTQPLAVGGHMYSTPSNGTNNGTATVIGYGGEPPYTYNWFNASHAGALTNLSDGTYSVIIRDARGCTASASVVVGLNVGIQQIDKPFDLFLLTPNPTQDLITLNFTDLSLVQDAQVIIYNSLGQVLSSQAVTSDKLMIDLSNQASGLYWVQLKTKENAILTKPIIKL